MAQPIEAAGFLLFAQQPAMHFLLMKHKDRWDLPKGHAEAGEDILTTALRETQEETGIDATSISVDPDFQHVVEYSVRGKKRGDYVKRVTYFLGYVEACREVELTEHVGYEWLSWPVSGPIQSKTIDPLLAAVRSHFEERDG